MFSILEICAFISYIYFKTIVIDNLHLFKKWREYSPLFKYVNAASMFSVFWMRNVCFDVNVVHRKFDIRGFLFQINLSTFYHDEKNNEGGPLWLEPLIIKEHLFFCHYAQFNNYEF